jgi:aspartyl-tRNA(Asn)/glutamyl-tRNA(Gln) amidotransferase subunit B
MTWEPVIGVEIHAQLATDTKIFCGCAVRAGRPPNTLVCPVCLGLPGALPVLNEKAVDFAILASLALGCQVQPVSVFARKNYFYPDLPKGYQISQYDRPLALDGALEWCEDAVPTRVGIVRVHLEEDAGKSLHDGFPDSAERSYVDFNRSGVPLIEIVTRPDLSSPAAAASFFARLRAILLELGVNGGNLEEGHLRCDANVSLRRAGDGVLGTPVEVKNLNSFRYLERALDHEIARQADVLGRGGRVERETRLWDVAAGRTVAMRSKELAQDYRYFPEPDLPPLSIDPARVEAIRGRLPELPEARRRRLVATYLLSEYDAGQMAASPATTRFFEAAAAASGHPKAAANWISGEVTRKLKETGAGIEHAGVTPGALAGLISAVETGSISGSMAKLVLDRMWGTSRSADDVVRANGLAQIDDEEALAAIVRQVVADHPKPVAQFKAGKKLAFGFLVGQVMKATNGQANPGVVNARLLAELERP